MQTIFKLTVAALMFLSIANTANAQKQPQIQEGSVRAPANIKVDGKLNEWGDKFLSAYNSASRVYYVVSNDDNNLYLTIRGLGTRVSVKALEGGMIFTISHTTEHKLRTKAHDNVTVMFPVPIELKSANFILNPERTLSNYMKDTTANRTQIDSIVAIANKRLKDAMKEIRVTGIKEITDTTISIYNTEGIKAMMLFSRLAPIIEISIPLKYLGLSVDNPVKFSYNIKLMAQPGDTISGPGINDDPMTNDELFLANTTDFWGEYMLVKKL